MHTFLIATESKKQQEEEVARLLKPLSIEPIDITRIAPDTSIGIEIVRLLKQQIALKPFKSKTKAVLIEEAQTLTTEAQNALLKTLEEPPDNTIIILQVFGNADLLLPTIISRAHVIELPHEKVTLSDKELSALSSQLSALLNGGVGERLKLAEDLAKDKESVLTWLKKMILTIRQMLITTISKGKNDPSITQLLRYVVTLQRTHTLLSTTNVNPRFTLETVFLSL